jgi:hypothetical protein
MGLGPSLPPAELARQDLMNFWKCSSLFLVHRMLALGAPDAGPSIRSVVQRGSWPVLVTDASGAEKGVSTRRVTSVSGVSGSDAKKCSCTDRTLAVSDQYPADASDASGSSLFRTECRRLSVRYVTVLHLVQLTQQRVIVLTRRRACVRCYAPVRPVLS